MIKVKPVFVNQLFPTLHNHLIALLKSLDEESWYKSTICPDWCVKDIVSHLLKDYIGTLSRKRDVYSNPNLKNKRFKDNKDFVRYINKINEKWINAAKTLSPRVLIELIGFTGELLFDYIENVDLMKVDSRVSWISEEKLPNWMDIAREYTEHWLHQTHIREAVSAPLLTTTNLFRPFIQTYMLALPKTYRNVKVQSDTKIVIEVTGNAGGNWLLCKEDDEWVLSEDVGSDPQTKIIIDQDTMWRLFSKGMTKENAEKRIKIKGNVTLGKSILNTVSLIA